MADIETQIQLIGARDAVAAFRDLRQFLPKSPLRSAVRKSARLMEQAIRGRAPELTGKLKRLISVRVRITRETVRARVVISTVGKANNPRNAFYWRFLERGFRTRSGQHRRFPFIQDVYESKRTEASQNVISEVDKAIKRAERKAKRAG